MGNSLYAADSYGWCLYRHNDLLARVWGQQAIAIVCATLYLLASFSVSPLPPFFLAVLWHREFPGLGSDSSCSTVCTTAMAPGAMLDHWPILGPEPTSQCSKDAADPIALHGLIFLIVLMSSETVRTHFSRNLSWSVYKMWHGSACLLADVCSLSLVCTLLILVITSGSLASDSLCRFCLLTWVSQFVEIKNNVRLSLPVYIWNQSKQSL